MCNLSARRPNSVIYLDKAVCSSPFYYMLYLLEDMNMCKKLNEHMTTAYASQWSVCKLLFHCITHQQGTTILSNPAECLHV